MFGEELLNFIFIGSGISQVLGKLPRVMCPVYDMIIVAMAIYDITFTVATNLQQWYSAMVIINITFIICIIIIVVSYNF